MSELTDKYNALWKEATEAKYKAFESMQQAMWNDDHGLPSDKEWAVQVEYGIKGVEGVKKAEAEKLCIDTLASNPSLFTAFVGKTQEQVVGMISAYKGLGLTEDATLGIMFEMANWERQNIGGEVSTRLRITAMGG